MRSAYRWILSALLMAAPAPALAQSPGSVNGLGDLILNLTRTPLSPTQLRILDTLFSGRIDAVILDGDGNNDNFGAGDVVAFGLSSISREGTPLIFSGNRAAFNDWAETNADAILAILFPGSLTESTSGIDVAQGHAQSFLVSTALAAGGRGNIGGRIEFERFDIESSSGNSVQGLFRVRAITVEGRYANLSDTVGTKSLNVGLNVHPSFGRGNSSREWRVGADGYVNTLYSTSRALDLGALDYGGGGWASGRVTLSTISLTFGGILLGSKTRIPLAFVDDSFDFVARVINERALRWDLTYGGAAVYPFGGNWSIGGKLLQSASVKSPLDQGRTSQLVLANLGYLMGGDRALDFGYRFSSGSDRFQAHGFFMNANFDF